MIMLQVRGEQFQTRGPV